MRRISIVVWAVMAVSAGAASAKSDEKPNDNARQAEQATIRLWRRPRGSPARLTAGLGALGIPPPILATAVDHVRLRSGEAGRLTRQAPPGRDMRDRGIRPTPTNVLAMATDAGIPGPIAAQMAEMVATPD